MGEALFDGHRLPMRQWIDALPDVEPMCRSQWLQSIEGRPQVAAIADDWWRMICDRVRHGNTIAQAATGTFQQILGYYSLAGTGDLRFLEAIELIENHMPEGREVAVWYAQTFGV